MNTGRDIESYLDVILSTWEQKQFLKWAFGNDPYPDKINYWMKRWNRKHKNKLLLKGGGDVKEDLLKMIEIWQKENP